MPFIIIIKVDVMNKLLYNYTNRLIQPGFVWPMYCRCLGMMPVLWQVIDLSPEKQALVELNIPSHLSPNSAGIAFLLKIETKTVSEELFRCFRILFYLNQDYLQCISACEQLIFLWDALSISFDPENIPFLLKNGSFHVCHWESFQDHCTFWTDDGFS